MVELLPPPYSELEYMKVDKAITYGVIYGIIAAVAVFVLYMLPVLYYIQNSGTSLSVWS